MFLPNAVGATALYAYFAYIDPVGPLPIGGSGTAGPLLTFAAVTSAIIAFTTFVSSRWGGPVSAWRRQLVDGVDPDSVPIDIRRRVLNVPLVAAVFSMIGWTLAGLFYFPYFLWISKTTLDEGLRGLIGIVFVGGPISSALAFLLSEFYWRRQIPLFYPYGHLERTNVLRIPVLTRLGATFLLTSVLPLLLMLIVDLRFGGPAGADVPDAFLEQWGKLMRAQAFIVVATSVASIAMAFLVTRFINRPVQALRAAMARVAAGDLTARVPVRSLDELGELNEHFNAMVEDLRRAERTREIFGRYVSPAVAGHALERGIALGGEVIHATAMFVDLRGFTALTQRSSAAGVVEVLNEYYAIVERVCEREGGIITQFLGDGVVIVFGAPLNPAAAHARNAVRAAVELQRALTARGPVDGVARLAAGIGICTGEMIAGNVGAGDRVTYTIVGDAVNQAARLQVKTRDLGASILITRSTRDALGDRTEFRLHPVGAVPLKGIDAPVEVFAVDV